MSKTSNKQNKTKKQKKSKNKNHKTKNKKQKNTFLNVRKIILNSQNCVTTNVSNRVSFSKYTIPSKAWHRQYEPYYNISNFKTKQNKTKQNKTKQNKTKQNKTKQNKPWETFNRECQATSATICVVAPMRNTTSLSASSDHGCGYVFWMYSLAAM